jgi:hypothetical protein
MIFCFTAFAATGAVFYAINGTINNMISIVVILLLLARAKSLDLQRMIRR